MGVGGQYMTDCNDKNHHISSPPPPSSPSFPRDRQLLGVGVDGSAAVACDF
jgi:hypothetical protein